MPIVFSAVASDRTIVSNFASCDGNFTEIAEQVLSKLPPCNNKMTYSHGIYLLHYIAEDDYLYFCITDKLCQRSRAFLFLNEIQRRFITSKQTDDFTTTLAAEMYRYSEDYSTIVIRKGELDELNSIGVGCSESLLGEKILYINNPDIISYSTISNVTATPGLISVSGLSSTQEELSLSTSTTEAIVIRSTPERETNIVCQPQSMTVLDSPPESQSPNSCTPEKRTADSQTSNDISPEATSEQMGPKSDRISAVSPNRSTDISPEATSEQMGPKSDRISAVSPNRSTDISPEATSEQMGPKSDRISAVSPNRSTDISPEATSEQMGPKSDRISAVSPNRSTDISPEATLERKSPTSVRISAVSPNQERISIISRITEGLPVMSPRLYIVIVGMLILVIAMSVYALGPISCVVVTGVGIYSLLRSYMGGKDKAD